MLRKVQRFITPSIIHHNEKFTAKMINFNFQTFNNSISKDIEIARNLVSDKENIIDRATYLHNLNKTDEEIFWILDEEKSFNERELSSTLSRIKLKLDFAFEVLNLKSVLTDFQTQWTNNHANPTSLTMMPYAGVLVCPALRFLEKFNSLISTQIEKSDKQEHLDKTADLERVLRGTPKIISDRKLIPKNEADVQKEMYQILIHIFPDTTREFPIPSVVKTYKPDFGIKSLKCAIEYKFVANEADSKRFIGGLYEDVHAYLNSEDWKTFYAVIYMNDFYYTQDQIEADFRASKVPGNWKPIVVYGKGERVKKKSDK